MRICASVTSIFFLSCGGGWGGGNFEGDNFGCDQRGWGRQQISSSLRAPDSKPWCGVYSVQITDDELHDISDWATVLIEYHYQVPEVCSLLGRNGGSVTAFIYMNLANVKFGDELNSLLDRLISEVRACPDYSQKFEGFYLDEPDFNHVDTRVIEEATTRLRREFPELSFLMYYLYDSSCVPPGTTHRGLAFYSMEAKNKAYVANRIERVHQNSNLPVVVIPRAWDDEGTCCDGTFGDFSDSDIEEVNREIFEVAERMPEVIGVQHYILTGKNGLNAKLPNTLETIITQCR
jgi:hypothetical protein